MDKKEVSPRDIEAFIVCLKKFKRNFIISFILCFSLVVFIDKLEKMFPVLDPFLFDAYLLCSLSFCLYIRFKINSVDCIKCRKPFFSKTRYQLFGGGIRASKCFHCKFSIKK